MQRFLMVSTPDYFFFGVELGGRFFGVGGAGV
jgi:hypothetical protein